jgi:hypothetical protein
VMRKRAIIIDAIRMEDNAKVVIKAVQTKRSEISLLRFLNSPKLRADSRNNLVNVFDIMLAPDNDEEAFVVMPRLMIFAVIPFQHISEVLDAFGQFLEVSSSS